MDVKIVDQLPDECPKCQKALEQGYGMMGGGIGVYAYCDDHYDTLYKVFDQE